MAEAGHRRWSTVRVRVTALATITVAVVLVATSAVLVLRHRAALLEQLDEALSADAERIAAAVRSNGAVPALDDDVIVVALDADGEQIFAAGDQGDVARLAAAEGDDITLDGESHRVVEEAFDAPGGGEGRVVLAGQRDDVDESVAELAASLAWLMPIIVAALGVLVWIVVGRTLRPVERIRARVAGIGLEQLDQRVPEPPGGDEVARLAATMNEMLARLEASVRRQQRFVADASHELRTPLTRMRTELEVDERDPERADPAATRRSQLEEIASLQRLIDDLLVLARSDAGALGRRSETVDLDDIVLEEGRDPSGRIVVDTSRVSAAQVVGSPDELRRAARNVLDNARRHATARVIVELAERNGDAVLVVADDGPGIPPERRREVFERFTRLDAARTGGGAHAGLGLAIVADIVTRHEGTVAIDEAPSGGARVTITLPSR